MTSFPLQIAGIIALFFFTCPSARGQPLVAPRIDRYGDSLPEGAIARLGTLRLTHLGGIEAVAISPDGTVAASGVHGKRTYLEFKRLEWKGPRPVPAEEVPVADATIRLWNVKTGELLRQVSTPDSPVTHIRFASDGKRLFAGCGKYLCCWESATGKKVWAREAIVGGRFQSVHVHEIMQAGATLVSLHNGSIQCPVEKKDRVLFYYPSQWVVRFWNAKTGEPLPLPRALQSTISAQTRVPILLHGVALTPDLKRCAIAVSEGEPLPRDPTKTRDQWNYPNSRVEIVDLNTGKMLLSIPNADGEFGKLALSADGSTVAAQTGKTIETPFDTDTIGIKGTEIHEDKDLWVATVDKRAKHLLLKAWNGVANLAFVGKDYLAAKDFESKVTVWRVDTGARVEKHDVPPETFCPACAAGVAVEARQNTVRLIDIKSGKPLHEFDGHRLTPWLRFAIRSPDTLISHGDDRTLLWDARAWKVARAVPMPRDEDKFTRFFWLAYGGFDLGICIEKGLYLHSGESNLELRDIKTNKTVRHIDYQNAPYPFFWFSPAGNRLYCEGEDGSYSFFDVKSGKRLAKTAADPGIESQRYYHCELSTHSKYFAKIAIEERPGEISDNHVVELYNVDTGKLLRKLAPKFLHAAAPGPAGSILNFKFSRDEELVLGEVHETGEIKDDSRSERVSVSIWKVETGEVFQDIVLDAARAASSQPLVGVVAISHDGRLIAMARTNGWPDESRIESAPIEIWEVASGAKRGELSGHGRIVDLAFSPDDHCLASSSDDTTILIWDLQRPLQPLKRGPRLTERGLDDSWLTLFERDAAKADLAIWTLIGSPEDSLPYLRKKVHPVPIPDAGRVRGLVADLNSSDFKVRTRANDELAKYGELIVTQIDQALKEAGQLEARQRLESLAKKARAAASPFGSVSRIGEWRAVEIVEKIGNPQAVEFLRVLASGAPDGLLTMAAKAALTRAETRAKAAR